MPIVGIASRSVTRVATRSGTHSSTTANAPAALDRLRVGDDGGRVAAVRPCAL